LLSFEGNEEKSFAFSDSQIGCPYTAYLRRRADRDKPCPYVFKIQKSSYYYANIPGLKCT
jgi:hypothetical protein